MVNLNIDGRLTAISNMICGDVIADVGSDHAYLPIWLYLNKKIKKAYALDISENCIKKIYENLEKYNISTEVITPVLSDGLSCFADDVDCPFINSEFNVVIAGMGGENIAEIMKKAQGFKSAEFILQPNSKVEILREFLYKNRYDIVTEMIVEDENRLYNIMKAQYTGVLYNPEPLEIIAGKNITHELYIKKIIKRLSDILADLEIAGDEKYNIYTEFGFYRDIEGYIKKLERLI